MTRASHQGVDAFGLKIYACGPQTDIHGYSLDATPLTGGNIIIHSE